MSSISSSHSVSGLVQPSALDSVTPAPPATTQRYTPLWLVAAPGSGGGYEALGLRPPSANGDLAVLLAEASLSLEKSVDANNKNKALANLGGLAGALAGFGLESLRQSVENKTKTVDESTKTLGTLTANTSTLLTSQKSLTDQIAGTRGEMATIRTELAKTDLSDARRAELNAQLVSKQTALDGLLAARQPVDIALAEARIGSLDQQIADLRTQAARAEPGSSDATKIAELIAKKTEARNDAADALAAFRSASKTEAVRDAFSAATRGAVQSTTSGLTLEVAAYETALATASATLETLSAAVIGLAMLAATQFNLTQARDADSQAGRDAGIEEAFEAIAAALDDASKAVTQRIETDADASAGAEEERTRRMQALAQTLLAALGDVVALLADQAGSPALPVAVPPETVANRVRVTI